MVVSTVSKAAMLANVTPGFSMIEQLLPEVTAYILSFLDLTSLCHLSMTSSWMRKAANDDYLWKSLYCQFTDEANGENPVNGWKAYYVATKEIMDVNYEFFGIVVDRSLHQMTSFWLNSDYVTCYNGSGELVSGYDAVMQRWEFCFDNWEAGYNLDPIGWRIRIRTNVAWVTTNAIHRTFGDLYNVTNVFELHNGRWLMVHHHSSTVPTNGVENH
ncbi:probable F-box protein At4g23960 isoform X2 [Capsella rubella]|uniref:probable F-box protein At4g23960 isoform X2 n=1 Tax=Capsella rubella TaxID=81985 RepID=UPI000CD52FA2|nr:probable F-box protein At4g23960 isoform X2 [Capsella rubella]